MNKERYHEILRNTAQDKANRSFYLESQFIDWVEQEGLARSTGKAYVTYMNNLCHHLLDQRFQYPFFTIIKVGVENHIIRLEDFLEYCQSMVTKEIHQSTQTPLSKKSLQNYRSGLNKYYNFILSLDEKNTFTPEEEKILEPVSEFTPVDETPDNKLLFDHDTLINNFTFRIQTQDRFYSDTEHEIYFPVRFLKRLFARQPEAKKFFQKWTEYLVQNIRVYTGPDTNIPLKEVKELVIPSSGPAFVTDKAGNRYTLYTPLSSGKEYIPMQVKLLRQIVIDHVEPMKNILKNNFDQLPALQAITRHMITSFGRKISPKEIIPATQAALQTSDPLLSYIPGLIDDLNFIAKKTNLQLMHWRENIVKSDK